MFFPCCDCLNKKFLFLSFKKKPYYICLCGGRVCAELRGQPVRIDLRSILGILGMEPRLSDKHLCHQVLNLRTVSYIKHLDGERLED